MNPVLKERRRLSPRLTCWGLGMLGLAIVISIMTDSAVEQGFAASDIAAPVLTTSAADLTLQADWDLAPDRDTKAA